MALIEFQDLPDTTTPLTASNLNNNFDELVQKINGTVLWENQTPNASFAGQDIAINNVGDYNYIEVYAKNYDLANYNRLSYIKIIKGYDGYLFEVDPEGSTTTRVVYVYQNKLTFSDAYYKRYDSTQAATADNNRAIPIKVIGYN